MAADNARSDATPQVVGEVAEVEPWDVTRLDLDPSNARLPEQLTDRSQIGLLRYFEEAYDLQELAWSMAEHGFFREEPLLTLAPEGKGERRVVIEGNRRLATLRLLTDPEARRVVGKPFWEEMAALAADHELRRVPTRNYPSRDSLLDYLGFRHVSGLLAWTADAKARYIHQLITEHGYTFERAGKVIGSRKDAIRRQFIAWRALEQARIADKDVGSAITHFGVYYRALQNPSIRQFLGVTGWNDGGEDLRSPLGQDGPDRLAELLEFVFGKRRVIRESRQLDDLGRALGSAPATALLRQERDLAMALLELPADRQAVYAAVRLSYRHAGRANAEAWQFRNDAELITEVRRLRDLVAQLLLTLENDRPVAIDGG